MGRGNRGQERPETAVTPGPAHLARGSLAELRPRSAHVCQSEVGLSWLCVLLQLPS